MAGRDVHQIPDDWWQESGLNDFKPSRNGFRCDMPHELVRISEIEPPLRDVGVTRDANGFRRNATMEILRGFLREESIPPIRVEVADPGPWRYRVRDGFHRYHSSLAAGFTHIPVEVVDRY